MLKYLFIFLLIANEAFAQSGANRLQFGDGAATNKRIIMNRGGSNPQFRWNEATSELQFSNDGSTFNAFEYSYTKPNDFVNLGLYVSVSSNNLVIALKQADGSTDPSTGSGLVKISMRSPTATSGGYNSRSISAANSLTVTSGTPLGVYASTSTEYYVYAIDSDGSGTMKLGVSTVNYGSESLRDIAAESFTCTFANATDVITCTGHNFQNWDGVQFSNSGGALPTGINASQTYWVRDKAANTFKIATDVQGSAVNFTTDGTGTNKVRVSSGRIVSDNWYNSVAVRVIGQFTMSQSTPGTYASNPTLVTVGKVRETVRPIMMSGIVGTTNDTTACTGSTCTMFDFSEMWFTSITRANTGTYCVNIPTGVCSTKPICWTNDHSSSDGSDCTMDTGTSCPGSTWSVNMVEIHCYNGAALSNMIAPITCQCMR